MSRKPKKRNKPYRGEDAATRPTVHHYSAVVRSPLGEWWQQNKRRVKWSAYIGGGTLIFVWLVWELFNLVF